MTASSVAQWKRAGPVTQRSVDRKMPYNGAELKRTESEILKTSQQRGGVLACWAHSPEDFHPKYEYPSSSLVQWKRAGQITQRFTFLIVLPRLGIPLRLRLENVDPKCEYLVRCLACCILWKRAGPTNQGRADLKQSLMPFEIAPSHLEIECESRLHKGPRDAERHFRVEIVSDHFEGLRTVQVRRSLVSSMFVLMDEM
ncbi:unnamed protein product [Toxocara canis]|uniref:RanBD1 domain-containing protein n=1 Tax=Toxocara canis TaxID=6265 RepID=A0A183VEC0_TOXCA|nr:unnamed protein product [Toxocara canis]